MTGDSFERTLEAWWLDFEVRCKRDLAYAERNKLLEEIVFVPVPGLMEIVKEASHRLACRTKKLIDDTIMVVQQMTARSPSVSLEGANSTASNVMSSP